MSITGNPTSETMPTVESSLNAFAPAIKSRHQVDDVDTDGQRRRVVGADGGWPS